MAKIRQRSDRTFQIIIYVGRDRDTGTERRVYRTFHGSKREATRFAAKLETELGNGTESADTTHTVTDLFDACPVKPRNTAKTGVGWGSRGTFQNVPDGLITRLCHLFGVEVACHTCVAMDLDQWLADKGVERGPDGLARLLQALRGSAGYGSARVAADAAQERGIDLKQRTTGV